MNLNNPFNPVSMHPSALGTIADPNVVIAAIAELNAALAGARQAGWSVTLSLNFPNPSEAQNSPFREVRAIINREA